MRTPNQKHGDGAESLVARLLVTRGWKILGRNVHAGRSELDILALDPGPPARLVVVEVRWRRSSDFGRVEETFDGRKRAHLIAGLGRLIDAGCLPDGRALPAISIAIDLAVVEPGRNGVNSVRLYRNALAL